MSFANWFNCHFAICARGFGDSGPRIGEAFQKLVEPSIEILLQGGKLIFFGNGDIAADAQHLATELVVRFKTSP
jgi:D-sedoheptulose 7-phosphate isomerase